MTEAEWLACEHWRPMLEFLTGRVSVRKSRLYVCAGLRSIWSLLYDDSSREAVAVAERAADGEATDEELSSANWHAECPTFGFDFDLASVRAQLAQEGHYPPQVKRLLEMGVYSEADLLKEAPPEGKRLGDLRVADSLENAAHIAYHSIPGRVSDGGFDEHMTEHLSSQEEWPGGWLVREHFGNPFRTVSAPAAWLSATAVSLAQAAYDERTLPSGHLVAARLAVLSDALEEAGCDNTDLLAHLRSPGPHVRGCWALDLVLGKQ